MSRHQNLQLCNIDFCSISKLLSQMITFVNSSVLFKNNDRHDFYRKSVSSKVKYTYILKSFYPDTEVHIRKIIVIVYKLEPITIASLKM